MYLRIRLTEFYHTRLNSNWTSRVAWIPTESPFPALACLLYPVISSLLNALEGECFCFCELSINVNKLLALLLLHVFIRFFYTALCYWLFISKSLFIFLYCTLLLVVYLFVPLFFLILTVLLYFCLLVNHVNKPLIFVYYFKNTTSN